MTPRPKPDDPNMKAAVAAVRGKTMTLRQASTNFNVAPTTLCRHSNGKHVFQGICTELSKDEEKEIAAWVIDVSKRGFPISQSELKDCVQLYLNKAGRKTKFKDNRPGHKWVKAFTNRHSILSVWMAENVHKSRASVTATKIRNWFSQVIEDMKEDKIDVAILSDPRRVFNLGECAFYLNPTDQNVIARKGHRSVYNTSSSKQCLTLFFGGNAIGESPPPLILHRNQRVPRSVSNNIPPSVVMDHSSTGWMTAYSLHEYITGSFNNWMKKQNIRMPVALFIDGNSSHMTLPLWTFCKENGIILIALLPNSTHLTQPLDVGIVPTLRSLWMNRRAQWNFNNNGKNFQSAHFAPLLKEVIDALKRDTNLFPNAFRACGIHPFDADAINYNKMVVTATSHTEFDVMPEPSIGRSATSRDRRMSTRRMSAYQDVFDIPVASPSVDVKKGKRRKQTNQEYSSSEDYNSTSAPDNDSDDDYTNEATHSEEYDAEPFDERPKQVIETPAKKRKAPESNNVSISAANSSTDHRVTNTNSIVSTSVVTQNPIISNDTTSRMTADEKWWQAQYGFYLKLNKKQQLKMKKLIFEMQLEFELENLEASTPKTIPKSEEIIVEDSDDDDPLGVSPPW